MHALLGHAITKSDDETFQLTEGRPFIWPQPDCSKPPAQGDRRHLESIVAKFPAVQGAVYEAEDFGRRWQVDGDRG